nr:MAG TPA: hypothetical protein [Caudoviricetes sp.]
MRGVGRHDKPYFHLHCARSFIREIGEAHVV